MKTSTLALVGALALVAAPALSGCETETAGTEDTARIVNDDSLDGLVDLNDSLDVEADSAGAALDEAGNAIGSAAGAAGAALGEAADSAGATVGRAADRAEDAVDANVDLGRNAENQGD